jgi:hypothetical protein
LNERTKSGELCRDNSLIACLDIGETPPAAFPITNLEGENGNAFARRGAIGHPPPTKWP